MASKLRSWLQKNKRCIIWGVTIVAILAVLLYLFVRAVYLHGWGWTGIPPYPVSWNINYKSNTTSPIEVDENIPSKTLWDFLQLGGVVAIPLAVGFGAAWFTSKQTKVSNAENRDNQRESALQEYINKISELLLNEHARTDRIEQKPVYNSISLWSLEKNSQSSIHPKLEGEAQLIARVRTLTLLRRLDAERKGSVLQFLQEAGLIDKNKPSIDLKGADFSKANLVSVNLSGADLDDVDLSGADLRGAGLIGTYLFKVDLSGADLREAFFRDADLGFANLRNAHLRHAYLSEVNLVGTKLIGANLSGANLSGANLSDADLSGANLCNVHFHGAKLIGANLSGAKLRGADLSDTDLSQARNVTTKQLAQAKSLQGAIM